MFPISLYTHYNTFATNKLNISSGTNYYNLDININLSKINLNINFPAYLNISSKDYMFSDCCEQTILNLLCYLLYDYKSGKISNENIDKMMSLHNNQLEQFKLNTFLSEMKDKDLGQQNQIIYKYNHFVPTISDNEETYIFNISNSPKILFQKKQGLEYISGNTELNPSLYNFFSLILYITGKISNIAREHNIPTLLQMFIELCTEFGKTYENIQYDGKYKYGLIIFKDITIQLNAKHAEIFKRIYSNGINIDLINNYDSSILNIKPFLKKEIIDSLLVCILDSPLKDFEKWYKSEVQFIESLVIDN